ncbi:hypothetical protein [Alkalibacterium olivapovliticus]|uniref:Oligogalacturonide lyase n=1 Tax=Alkalibacterium olivapovliticus TaxID=99907 RepID=A0A2T0W7K1_9LACT|nr:hypothetical protein [Alkalibacterium olivapovliticus]PRY82678.1 hypothetical protein CLV38_1097 [Alkalibacterium olivapovliticus]
MNRLERTIYDLVKKNTKIKNAFRDSYQFILAVIPQKRIVSNYNIIEREGYFFGFHDKIPWSHDNKMLLSHKFNIPNREPTKGEQLEIGYFHGKDFKEFKSLGKTESWNWQQGSMLQWMNNENRIIFNDWDGENNIARIIDLEGKEVLNLDRSISAVDNNGVVATSYSFERLNIGMYGYGYANENDQYKLDKAPKKSGMSIIELKTGNRKEIFSVYDISEYDPNETMIDAYHFFTHCLFSPTGNRFLFLHRWYQEGKQLHSRMISCDINGDNIHVFPTGDMVSHITWKSNNEVFAYCNTEKHGDGYHIFKDKSDEYTKVGSGNFTSDGHPQYCYESGLIVTDSYPNRFRIQELNIFHIEKNHKKIIAKLWSPRGFKDTVRCDLHPRWDRSGKMLCFDSAHTGKRSLCTVKL